MTPTDLFFRATRRILGRSFKRGGTRPHFVLRLEPLESREVPNATDWFGPTGIQSDQLGLTGRTSASAKSKLGGPGSRISMPGGTPLLLPPKCSSETARRQRTKAKS